MAASDDRGSWALRGVLAVARRMAAPSGIDELLGIIIEAGREIVGADRGAVFLYDPQRGELWTRVATNAPEIRIRADSGIAGACAMSRGVVHVPDCYADPRFNASVDRDTGYRTRCLLAVPLIGLEGELVGVMQLLNPPRPDFTPDDVEVAKALAAQAAVALQRATLLLEREEKLKLERDLALARQIQAAVLPDEPPAVPGYAMAGFNRPADQTGGDIFDLRLIGERLYLLMADATGHGIGPALSVTQLLAMMRIALRAGVDPALMIQHANAQLNEDLPEGRFITAFFGMLFPQQHELIYVSAGQAPLLHVRGRELIWLDASTLPLGILEDLPMDPTPPLRLEPGDLFVLLTDGFYEYRNPAGRLYGKERVGQVVLAASAGGPQAIIDALLADVAAFGQSEPQHDDLTAVIVQRQADA